ncbi:hypothetical protein LINPERHAP2_LOCUS35631 [Linum perenne]
MFCTNGDDDPMRCLRSPSPPHQQVGLQASAFSLTTLPKSIPLYDICQSALLRLRSYCTHGLPDVRKGQSLPVKNSLSNSNICLEQFLVASISKLSIRVTDSILLCIPRICPI